MPVPYVGFEFRTTEGKPLVPQKPHWENPARWAGEIPEEDEILPLDFGSQGVKKYRVDAVEREGHTHNVILHPLPNTTMSRRENPDQKDKGFKRALREVWAEGKRETGSPSKLSFLYRTLAFIADRRGVELHESVKLEVEIGENGLSSGEGEREEEGEEMEENDKALVPA